MAAIFDHVTDLILPVVKSQQITTADRVQFNSVQMRWDEGVWYKHGRLRTEILSDSQNLWMNEEQSQLEAQLHQFDLSWTCCIYENESLSH